MADSAPKAPITPNEALRRIRWPLRLTHAGMWAEAAVRAFWPLWSVLIASLAVLMLGLQDMVPVEWVWAGIGLALFGALAGMIWGARRFAVPTRNAALDRLDRSIKGRPIAALTDEAAIGRGDAAAMAVWRAHQDRMAERAARARPAKPDLAVSRRDPFALRYVALLALSVALLFGSFWRVGTVTEMAPGGSAAAAIGPSWEGWVEPPSYTGLPALYLNDQTGRLRAPQGSRITLRLYGEIGALTVAEDISGAVPDAAESSKTAAAASAATEPSQSFELARSGTLAIEGPGGRSWDVVMTPDSGPRVQISATLEKEADGEMRQAFLAQDDHGVVAGTAAIMLDLTEVDRRYGLGRDPDPRDALLLDLPMPITGDRREFEETIIENFSEHPFANLPVTLTLTVEDALGQTGSSADVSITLPGRRFFDPLAAAVIEQRQALLWSRENGADVARMLRAISHRPDDIFRSETAYLRLRVLLRRLETMSRFGIKPAQQEEVAKALWDLAITLEEGDLADAQERLRRAQDRLAEAMKNGASDEEIAELMNELRDAMRDYMRQLAQNMQPGEDGVDEPQMDENTMELTQQDLQDMMDRIQELMEQGRMDEAQALLDQLSEMMENMQMAEGQGQGQQSPGQQAMEGLAETLRDQQGLSDQAFRDLQEQFNPNMGQQGQAQGNEGRSGGEGRGQSHEGQGGEGENQQQGEGQGEGQQQGQQQGQQPGEGSLADRQQALRDELRRQQDNLPGVGGQAGEDARDALDRAGRAMEGAEEALRGDDLAEAIDQQAEAMDALRDGMRNLGEAMAEQQQQQSGQQGEAMGRAGDQQRDPLGRNAGESGQVGTDDQLLQGEDVYRRARELLDEIRRRSGEGTRNQQELDYLKRLLERF